MEIGKRIAWFRDKKGWSQKELAIRAGLNQSVMNRIETGERPLKAEELKIIADLFDVQSDFLLGRSSDPRLSFESEKEVDSQIKEIMSILDEMPEDKRNIMKSKIIAYAKGLADADNHSN